MKQNLTPALAVFLAVNVFSPSPVNADPWKSLELWLDGVPGEEETDAPAEKWQPAKEDGDPDITRLGDVTRPSIDVYPAEGDKPKPAVVIFPGGGYYILAMKHEGTMVADWLNEMGYTAVVLKYRVPRRKDRAPHEAPLEDAHRALELTHQNAEQWKIDPDRIGVLGFSAGGNLAAHVAYGKGADALPAEQKADFAVLIYPAYLLNEDNDDLSGAFEIHSDSPPAFLAHAHDDRRSAHVEGSVRLYLALSRMEVLAELHVYAEGKHGFGMLDRGLPINTWPDRCEEWLERLWAEE